MARDGRSVAWLAYVPVPGFALFAVVARPGDRLVRYHAWQGSAAVVGLLAFLVGVGLLARISDGGGFRAGVGFLAGLGLLAGLAQLGWGGAAAARGRYARLRPWWDLCALVKS